MTRWEWLLIASLAAALIALALMGRALWRSRRATRQVKEVASRLSRGDLSTSAKVSGPKSLREVGDSLGHMAGQLRTRLSTVLQQRNELGAVVSSMVEGVLAIDLDQRIISLNRAAAEMLELEIASAIGRTIHETVRNTMLQQMVTRAIDESVAVSGELTLRRGEGHAADDRQVQVQGAVLRDGSDQRIGVVIVLHDVTRLRRLESVRRDFVANVSHEIKTPVSAIKAAIETLIDSGELDAPDRERFMGIVARQADRLDAIIEDLLNLARLEEDDGELGDELRAGEVRPAVEAAIESCQARAEAKQIEIIAGCEPDLCAHIRRTWLEQALVNLIDNAIKYSPEGTRVEVSAEHSGGETIVRVKDHGPGIEPEHLPRIFERFYRTDRARSRLLGGTGLGLSIVKHVAEAHRGRVTVSSELGSGSTFAIHLRHAEAPDEDHDEAAARH